jgi:hypothetical protein
MSESLPHGPSIEDQMKQELRGRFISLAKELSHNPQGFPFPGVNEETIEALKAVEEEYPGYANPVDEVIDKMKEGIKIVLGEDPESGNVYVLPISSNSVEMDSLLPRHLDTNPEMDESLRSLILAQKALLESEQKKDE